MEGNHQRKLTHAKTITLTFWNWNFVLNCRKSSLLLAIANTENEAKMPELLVMNAPNSFHMHNDHSQRLHSTRHAWLLHSSNAYKYCRQSPLPSALLVDALLCISVGMCREGAGFHCLVEC